MIELAEAVGRLDSLLECAAYADDSLNGLQVETGTREIRRIAFAVDSGLSVIEEAVRRDSQLLVVHHGILWGACEPITGPHGKTIAALLAGGLSLYAAHLPLDGHLQLGHAACIAHGIGLSDVEGFAPYRGRTIGASGTFRQPMQRDEAIERARRYLECSPGFGVILPFGPETVRRVAVATGSGSFAVPLCAREGIDLLISGEPKQEVYHRAKELGLNAAFLGHYRTERPGMLAVMDCVARSFGVEVTFIEEDTGI